ncbi:MULTISPECIES: arsenic resistance protein [Brevundimonas]|jgi:arsenite transporter|uniref:Arsenic resistance protein n=3 Tax=Brevundimonas TaxID=41275 RepID=A0AB37E376_9CAUL|nr:MULTISPECIES: arsenic resistance protein [Brevundimonas]EDX79961.1 Sodium Bile acid symporter family [Brevundimonas sp. BAL3]MBA4332401.1 arsenic resistance protein [Brevundimonas sp.]QIH71901.1 arsenic resistance protein [Brevundimonas mediterranea]QYC11975.1 arsenic resistance protein [Brevundimonas nasdae]QYC14762.1 arsenic resistance protein [Brevundimonas nasdae]
MNTSELRDGLEARQVWIYFAAVIVATAIGFLIPRTEVLESAINPALALMLFVTFLQVPVAALGRALQELRFLGALLAVNFIAVPLFVLGLMQFLPADPLIRLGVLMVLLCPCIDYVVTFAHLGRADARLLLASTPMLLIAQMVLLPIYLRLFLGAEAAAYVQPGPFIHAFVWLIAIPFVLAALVQTWAARSKMGERVSSGLGLAPVPATALVLFIVVAAVMPQLGQTLDRTLSVVPVYVAFSVLAPLIGWAVSRLARLTPEAGRAVAFSAGTRNSLVVLPLALVVPGAIPLVPAIIVTQTLIELLAELVYIRGIHRLGRRSA